MRNFKTVIVFLLMLSFLGTAIFAGGARETKDEVTPVSAGVFNPDVETDAIKYEDLEREFGPIPFDKLPKNIVIGSILKNLANEFWILLGDGMEEFANKHGVALDMQATRTETDTAGQLAIAETMIEKDYHAVIFSPLTNDNLNSAVEKAKSKGLPVVNANCEYIAACDTFVGGLQIEIGRKVADYFADKLNGSGKIAVLEGVPGTFTANQRMAGFMEKIQSDYPNLKVVASVPADYEVEKGMNVTANILTQHPDIDAIYAHNDNMALGAIEALRATNQVGKVLVVGVDGTGDAYKSIKKGEMTATADQFPAVNGMAAVDVALRLLAGQDLPKVVSTKIEVVDQSNLALYDK